MSWLRRDPERGKQGDHGQDGIEGPQGIQGPEGPRGRTGLRSRTLTWTQALAMFLLIVVIGLVMAVNFERQQTRIENNQAAIQENSRRIAEERYLGCLGGVQIIEKINTKVKTLAAIERRNTKDPLAKERVKAYEKALITLPDPACRR